MVYLVANHHKCEDTPRKNLVHTWGRLVYSKTVNDNNQKEKRSTCLNKQNCMCRYVACQKF